MHQEHPDEIVTELTRQLRPIFEKHHVLRAVLFGSFARGDASRHSDVDIILAQDTEKRFLDRYDDILREITAVVPGPGVDLLIYTPREIASLAGRPFVARALAEGKLLYESEQEPIRGRAVAEDG